MKIFTISVPGNSNADVNPKIIIILLFIFAFPLFAQLNFPTNTPQSFNTMRNNINADFATRGVVNGYIDRNGVQEKVPNYNIFKRWEYYWEQRMDNVTGDFPNTDAVTEYTKWKNSLKKQNTYTANWINIGTNYSSGGYAGLGRINSVAFHPSDNNTFWVGSPSGGLWKTTDGGSSWTILNNSMTVLGVSDIVIPSDYATSNTMYIATGDRDGGSMWSLGGGQVADNATIGVMKSTDGGSTWAATGLTYTTSQKKLVYRILLHPSNNQILIAATTDGIYKSTNGGTSWTQKKREPFL